MASNPDQIRLLVQRPAESLQVELKTWLDPRTDDGIAKLVKGLFALRNRNGGFLVIGFDNATLAPNPYPLDQPVEALYHVDEIQGLVSRYTSPSFEIAVSFEELNGQAYPVISVPEGVRVPAVIKRDLIINGGKKLLTEGEIYFRTFNTNGTASSARIRPADYADLLEVCFENREADIGRFLRRHLRAGEVGATLVSVLGVETESSRLRSRAFSVLEGGTAAADAVLASKATDAERERITKALTMRIGLALEPIRPDEQPTQTFMNKIATSNPNFTGWPIWLDTRNFTEREQRAYVMDGVWQALLLDLDGGWYQMAEFLRYDPRGEFYLQRVMQDDLTDQVEPGTSLDVTLMIYRVAEAMAVGTNFGRTLGWEPANEAAFAFRWTGLEGRSLRSWVNSFRAPGFARGQSRSASADAYVTVPIETPYSALAPYVASAVGPLFALFDGYAAPLELIETSVRKLIERKLDS